MDYSDLKDERKIFQLWIEGKIKTITILNPRSEFVDYEMKCKSTGTPMDYDEARKYCDGFEYPSQPSLN
jgi:hypothetical protein